MNPKNITETIGVVKACTLFAIRMPSTLISGRHNPRRAGGFQNGRYWRVRFLLVEDVDETLTYSDRVGTKLQEKGREWVRIHP